MTPKEKAKELADKYLNASFNCKGCDMIYCDIKCNILAMFEAKECALIAVDEILNAIDWDYYEGSAQTEHNYWQEVKQEIEKL
jgi:hypothetical protein